MNREKIRLLAALLALTCVFCFCAGAAATDKSFYRNEMRKDRARDSRRSSRIQESRNYDYELGKCVTDVNGNRIRLEEYAVRTRPDQVKVVTLTKNAEIYGSMYSLYTFNRNLPSDFSSAAREGLKMSWSEMPAYWLTEFESKHSCGSDYIKYAATGGSFESVLSGGYKQYFASLRSMVNSELNVKEESAYNPVTKDWTYYYYLSGIKTEAKSWDESWDAANNAMVRNYYSGVFSGGSPTGTLLATRSVYAFQDKLQYKTQTVFADAKSLTIWNYIVSTRGEVVSAPSLWSENFVTQVLNSGNYEMVVTASEFSSGKVDIIGKPGILLNTSMAGR